MKGLAESTQTAPPREHAHARLIERFGEKDADGVLPLSVDPYAFVGTSKSLY